MARSRINKSTSLISLLRSKMAKKSKYEGTNIYGVLGVIVVVAIVAFVFFTRTPSQAPTGAITAVDETTQEEIEVQEATTEAPTPVQTTTAPTTAATTTQPATTKPDIRTFEEQQKYGSWCVRTKYNELTDPVLDSDRLFWMAADHYVTNKYTLEIEKTLAGSNLVMATGFWVPISEFEYQSYEIKNLNIEGRVKGKDREYNILGKYLKSGIKIGSAQEGWERNDDLYLLWNLNDAKVGDVLQYKIDYDIGSTHYTVCKEENLTVSADRPMMELKILNQNPFKGGPQWYNTEFTLSGTDNSAPSRNIFKQSVPEIGEIGPYALIVYKKDFIKKYEPYLSYEVKVEEIPGACSDSKNCKYKLSFSTGSNPTETWENLCKGEAYLVFGVYSFETEEASEVFYKLDPNSDIAAFCTAG
ncbi:TPA: hypothetical protein H1016_04330 [archaeon]|uniref:Uncharacterized protein n=1 Tax=Candidatus Naiadarchaeum limnaeum TaxID=2756139 RepID=A0A832XJK7_9ARCH|nr:hypothetical protein [Candidatus Naiadarchaeum limnaeum]